MTQQIRRTLLQMANGTRTSYTYDTADHLTELANLKSGGQVISTFRYTYNPAGSQTSVLESTGDRVTYGHDVLEQLTNERRSGASALNTTYTYDQTGNRTIQNADGTRTTYSYDAANQLTIIKDPTGVTTYTFDENGNQKVVLTPQGDRPTYLWDYENQNNSILLPSGRRVTLLYNALNRRVRRDT